MSGLRVIDWFALPSVDPKLTEATTTARASFTMIEAPELLSDSPDPPIANTSPLAVALPNAPVGFPPPKTPAASPAGMILPGGKVNSGETEVASVTVKPPISRGADPV